MQRGLDADRGVALRGEQALPSVKNPEPYSGIDDARPNWAYCLTNAIASAPAKKQNVALAPDDWMPVRNGW